MNQRSSPHPFLRPALLLAFVMMAQSVALADWLVTRDGTRVETEGTWRVEGRQVIFTLPGGTLSAMRLSEVDVDASRAATEAANRPVEPAAQAAQAPRPEPVLVLTDKDIPRASTDSGLGGDADMEATTGLRVIEWNLQPYAGGVILIGRLENGTQSIQSGIRVRVDVRNEDDEVLASAASILAQESLVAGGITVFRARFAGFSELPGEPHFVIFGPGGEGTPEGTDPGDESGDAAG